jgi:serine/threonine protein phosphatase PrpC
METEEGSMAVLADGMGKQLAGKIAARLTVQAFRDMFEDRNAFYNPQYSFRKAFQGANREILNQLDENQGCASVGAMMLKARKLYYAVVGNVRVAVYRNHELVPVSSGHTINLLAKQKYEEGKLTREEAVSLLNHHRLYNFVGQDGFQDVEFFDTPINLYRGEYVLLMSDGLYETARWKDMEECLEMEGDCQQKAYRLIELVNQSAEQEKDNAAVVVMQVR